MTKLDSPRLKSAGRLWPMLLLAGCTIHHLQPYTPMTQAAPDTADAAAASTNCLEASTQAEQAVCADPALAAINRRLAETFQAALRQADPFGRDALTAAQRSWLLRLPTTCHLPAAATPGPPDIACLKDQFAAQVQTLSGWRAQASPARALAQYVRFRLVPGPGAAGGQMCTALADGLNASLRATGTADPGGVPGAHEIAGTHGPNTGEAAGQPISVSTRLANAFGGFAQRARGVTMGGHRVLDSLSLGRLAQAGSENQGARFSAYASQTGDYGVADVFSYGGQTLGLLADSWGFYAPASPGEFAAAGVWALTGRAATPLCLFQTFQMPAEESAFDALPSFAPWRDALLAIRDSAAAPLGVGFLRDQGQMRAETNWLLLHMPLVVAEQARAGGWVPWLRLRHDIVLDALFAWAEQDAAHKALFDRAFALLKPAAQDLVRAYQQSEALDGAEAKQAAALAVMELLYGATLNIAPDLGADLAAPASAAGRTPRYPILATPQ